MYIPILLFINYFRKTTFTNNCDIICGACGTKKCPQEGDA